VSEAATRMVLNLQSQGVEGASWILLSHALGCDLSMYQEVAADLASEFHVLAYDHRDHGASQKSPGAYGISDLADDAADLIRAKCAGQPVIFVGVSMGGMTAQALAARHPSLVRGIVVANSAQHYSAEGKALWQTRIDTVRAGGMAAISDGAMQRWFTPEFFAAHPDRVARAKQVLEACDAKAYERACQAVAALDTRKSNASIRCPALVLSGEHDLATPPALSDDIAAAMQASAFVKRASLATSHFSPIEQPHAFAQLVRDFARSL
jgi:3-oxoadipate enol-lactonase